MSGATATLAISGLTSGYGEEIVVRGISLTVGSGEIVALLGKNGMGKSTLLKTVMGFLPAREGQVTLYGHDVTRDSPHRIARRAIAYTPQEQAIFQDLTVGDNLRLGQSEARWFEEELERVGEVFPFLEERLGQRAGTLSGGEQKMLLIARTLMEMDLAERLLLVLEAGNDAGGDKRGKQSAALQVHHTESYPWLDLRVDEHPRPVTELRRIATIARLQLLPFVGGMPRRGKPAGALPDSVSEMLLSPPPDRPGGGGSAP